MSQPRRRESGDFWAGVTCTSGLEGEMPPKCAADTEPHTRGWGTRGLPFIWKSPAPTCQGFGSSSPGTQFCCKSSSFFFFQECAILFYFFNFLFRIGE